MYNLGQCEKNRGTIILEKITGVVLRSAKEVDYEIETQTAGITKVRL